jgi:hypothetical protein
MRGSILIGLLCAMACRGEKTASTAAATTTVAPQRAPSDTLVPRSASPDSLLQTGDSNNTTESAGASANLHEMPTPEQQRDSAIAFANRESDCAKAPPDSESGYFHGARPSREFFPDAFCFSIDGTRYVVTSSGDGFRISSANNPYPFRVSVEDGFDMTFLAYSVIGSRIYFLYEMTDSEDGGGGLEAVDKTTLRPSWAKPAKVSFNVGTPLITDSVAYVTGINEVGKVRLSDGKFVWKHLFFNNLEPLPGLLYNAFDTPVRENGVVRFIPDSATSRTAGTLVVDDKSGVVIEPEVLKGQKPACTGEQPYC